MDYDEIFRKSLQWDQEQVIRIWGWSENQHYRKKVILENNWWTNYQFESSCQMYVCMVEGFKKKSYNWITTLAEVCIHTSLVLQYFSDREKYGQIVVFKT